MESDGRKAAFLREANRVMGGHARLVNKRIEAIGDGAGGYDLITARALASLPKLLETSNNLLKTGGKLLFLKGKVRRCGIDRIGKNMEDDRREDTQREQSRGRSSPDDGY